MTDPTVKDYQAIAVDSARELQAAVDSVGWYHTIALPHGVTTPGSFDTLDAIQKVPLPSDLSGMRCLDVGTANGFWAFEMERRGAEEVVAVDVPSSTELDWPPASRPPDLSREDASAHRAFEIAHAALQSDLRLERCSIYDLSPERFGSFDFVFIGSLLLHLRDPVRALTAVRSVSSDLVLSADAASLSLTLRRRVPAATFDGAGRPYWWTPNAAAHRSWFESAGFDVVDEGRLYFMRLGGGYRPRPAQAPPRWRLRSRAHASLVRRVGLLHHWLIARPAA